MRLPAPTDRYRHENGAEYTVECLANTDSTRPEYPATVVYRGDNGKVWAKTLDNFLAKMTFVPRTEVEVAVTDRGPVEVYFQDHMGYRVVLEEHPTAEYLKIGYPNQMPVLLDRERAQLLANYLGYYLHHGQLPEEAL